MQRVTICSIAAILFLAAPAWATDFTVNSDGDEHLPGGNTFCSLTPAATEPGVCTLRAALELAHTGDVIHISASVTLIKLTNGQLRMQDKAVDIYGAASTRTTIDAQTNSRGLLIDAFTGVSARTVSLYDLNFINGRVSGNGGGVSIQNLAGWEAFSRLIVTRVDFNSNVASNGYGGGLWGGVPVTAIDTTFIANEAQTVDGGGSAGGLAAEDSAVLTRVLFEGNHASFAGGGAYLRGLTTIDDVTFVNNVAESGDGGGAFAQRIFGQHALFDSNSALRGGGVYVEGEGSLELARSRFVHNTATESGGGIYNGTTSRASLSYVAVEQNTAGSAGGGWAAQSVTSAFASHSSFSDNQLTRGAMGGAGIYAEISTNENGYSFVLSNTTLAKNHLATPSGTIFGGGLYLSGYFTALLSHVTIADNDLVKGRGAGVFVSWGGPESTKPQLFLANTIIARNKGSTTCDSSGPDFGEPTSDFYTSLGYNATASDCPHDQTGDFASEDPGLDASGLSDNGGETRTIALVSGSAAIDAANPVQRAAAEPVGSKAELDDQRGITRPIFGRDALRADIGAFEYQPHADLTVTKTSSASPVVGTPMTYTITVTNNGPDFATGVTVSDNLPASLIDVSFTITSGSCTQTGALVSCTIGTLAGGASAVLSITATPTVAGPLTNNADATGSNDPNGNNNRGTDTTTVGYPTPSPTPTGGEPEVSDPALPPGRDLGAPVTGAFTGSGFARPNCSAASPGEFSALALLVLLARRRKR